MPHLRLEHSANLPLDLASDALLRELDEVLERVGRIRMGNCKTRVLPASRFLVGRGEEDAAFVHLDVRFLEGRSGEVRQRMGAELLRLLTAVYEDAAANIQITVEIDEIERATYFKHPPGTLTPPNESSSAG